MVLIDGIPEEVFEQYEKIRLSGETNMFDWKAVMEIAFERNYYELIGVAQSREAYGKILERYSKWREHVGGGSTE